MQNPMAANRLGSRFYEKRRILLFHNQLYIVYN